MDNSTLQGNSGIARKSQKGIGLKVALFVFVFAIFGCGAFFGWPAYEARSEKSFATDRLREISAICGRQLSLNTSENISYAEHISRYEQAIKDIESAVVMLKAHRFSQKQESADAVEDFAASAQLAIRDMRSQARLQLLASVAGDRSKESMAELAKATSKYALSSSVEAAQNANKDHSDALQAAIRAQRTLTESLGQLYRSDYRVKGALGDSEGLDTASLAAIKAIKQR